MEDLVEKLLKDCKKFNEAVIGALTAFLLSYCVAKWEL